MGAVAGEYTDAETGFSYLRARYYDPATGQFLTRDPIEAQTREPYGYVGGNPLNATDPSGLCWGPTCVVEAAVKGGGALIGAVGDGASWVAKNPTTTLKVGALALGVGALTVTTLGFGGVIAAGTAGTLATNLGIASTVLSVGVALNDCTNSLDINCAADIAEAGLGAATNGLGLGAKFVSSRLLSEALALESAMAGIAMDLAAFADFRRC